jgi:hypothetical protein
MRILSFIYLLSVLTISGILITSCNNDIGQHSPGDTQTDPPVPGAAISFSNIATTSVTVSWGAAIDSESLEYKVVKALGASGSGDIDTIDEVKLILITDENMVMYWSEDTSVEVTDLEISMEYYFAVLVKDRVGNMELYFPEYIDLP